MAYIFYLFVRVGKCTPISRFRGNVATHMGGVNNIKAIPLVIYISGILPFVNANKYI